MITKITPVEELKRIFTETFLNHTDKVTKISDGSVLNGTAYGIGKLAQKVLKDAAVIEAHLFADSAYGEYLDTKAELDGVAPRFTETASSAYVRVVGDVGTTYSPTSHVFKGKGVNFIPQSLVVIPQEGYAYVKVKSASVGSNTNVDPLSINSISPVPSGHLYCINEFGATGGRDNESDDAFRQRIKEEINVLSRNTISYLEQVFRKINPDVLKVFNLGLDKVGDLIIGVSSVNGADFSTPELDELFKKGENFFSMNELKPDGMKSYGIKLANIPYTKIDISARVDIDSSSNIDRVRRDINIAINKVVDYRTWENGGIIDWIDLINAIKGVNGVSRVLDNYFYPNNDIIIPKNHLPRFRGFALLNLKGELIEDLEGTLNPIYYPNQIDFNYQATVLKSL